MGFMSVVEQKNDTFFSTLVTKECQNFTIESLIQVVEPTESMHFTQGKG
jgi:hypothetical protein